MKFRMIFIGLFLSLFLCSCSGIVSPDIDESSIAQQNGPVTLTGKIELSGNGAVPDVLVKSAKTISEEAAKAAFPNYSSVSVVYVLTATNASNESVTGTVTSGDGSISYSISLNSGTWSFVLNGYNGSSDGECIFQDASKSNITISSASDAPAFKPSPYSASGSTGTVSIPVSVDSDSGVSKCVATWTSGGTEYSQTINFNSENSYAGTFTLISDGGSTSSVASGVYDVNFGFYNSDSTPKRVYGFKESVSVFGSLTTNYWISNTAYISGNSTISVSKTLAEKASGLTSICVDSNQGNDSSLGDFFNPLKTVSAAISLASAYGMTAPVIYLKRGCTFTQTESLTITIDKDVASYTIKDYGDSNSGKPVIKQDSTLKDTLVNVKRQYVVDTVLTIQNVVFQGAGVKESSDGTEEGVIVPTNSKGGGGLYISDVNVVLDGCTVDGFYVYKNSTKGSGGGIYYEGVSGHSLTLKNTTVSNNYVYYNGGGVAVLGGSLKLNGATITGNYTTAKNSCGGGIYVGSSDTSYIGKIEAESGAALNVVSNNTSASDTGTGNGGNFYFATGGNTLDNFLITEGKAGYGSAIYYGPTGTTRSTESVIKNTIITNNSYQNSYTVMGSSGALTFGTSDGSSPVVIGTTDTYTSGNTGLVAVYSNGCTITLYSDVTIGNAASASMTGNSGKGVYAGNSSSIINYYGAKIQENSSYSLSVLGGTLNIYGPLNLSSSTAEAIYKQSKDKGTIKLCAAPEFASGVTEKVKVTLGATTMYAEGTVIFTADDSTYFSNIKNFFEIDNESDNNLSKAQWYISNGSDGGTAGCMLQDKIYVSSSGNDSTGDGSYSNPYLTIDKAVAAAKTQNSALTEKGSVIYAVSLKSDITFTDSSTFTTDTETNGANAVSITSDDKFQLIIEGYGSTVRTINAGATSSSTTKRRVLYCGAKTYVTLKNISLTGGYTEGNGGGIYAGTTSYPTFDNCTITANNAASGGGIYAAESSGLTFKNSITISSNNSLSTASGSGGGGIFITKANLSTYYVSSMEISGNTAARNGGGMEIVACGTSITSVELKNFNFINNHCYIQSADSSAQSYGLGGGLFITDSGESTDVYSYVSMTNCKMYGNYGNFGGAISVDTGCYFKGSTTTLGTGADSTATPNYSSSNGGAINGNTDSTITLNSDFVVGNTSITTTPADSASSANYSGTNGGAIYFAGKELRLAGTVQGNYAANGKGIYMDDVSASSNSIVVLIDGVLCPDEIYLCGKSTGTTTSKYVDITALSGTADTQKFNLTLAVTTAGQMILHSYSATYSSAVSTYYSRFTVNNSGWQINSEGKLEAGSSAPNGGNDTSSYTITSSVAALGGTVPTSGNVYSLSTEAELQQISTWVAASSSENTENRLSGVTFVLYDNIPLTSDFTPIGSDTTYFKGTFDGNGNKISGLSVSGTTCGGLFGNISNGTIKNLTVEGSVSGTSNCGGIVGYLNSSVVDNCVSKVTVTATASSVGGIAGEAYGSCVINNCINIGAVTSSGGSSTGGIYGSSDSALSVYNCANLGSITASSGAGGLAGTVISNSYFYNSYNAGTVSVTGVNSTDASSIAASSAGNATYTNVFWFTGTCSQAFPSSGTAVGVTAEATSAVSTLTSTLNDWVTSNPTVTVKSQSYTMQSWSYTYTKDSVAYPVCVKVE